VPIPMLDREGRPVEVPDLATARAAFERGELGFAPGARVPIVDRRSGELQSIDASEVEQAFGAGFELAEPEAFAAAEQEARRQREFGTVPQQLQTAAEGFERGLSLGLSDVTRTTNDDVSFAVTPIGQAVELIDQISGGRRTNEERAERISERQEANPLTAGASEFAGTLPAALVPIGGEAAAARTSLTLGRLALRTAAREGARGAVEGAAYGVGQTLSEDALGRAALTGERLAANGLTGALLGLGGGTLFGGAGAAFGRATEPAREIALNEGQRALSRLDAAMSSESVERFAREQAFRSLGGRKRFVQEAERHGGMPGIGEVLLRRGIVNARDGLDATAERLVREVSQVGEEIGGLVQQADTIAEAAPSLERIAAIRDDFVSKLRGARTGSGERLARQLEAELAPIFREFDPDAIAAGRRVGRDAIAGPVEQLTVSDLHAWRRAIDDTAFRGTNAINPNPLAAELQGVRRAVEDEIEASMERAGGEIAAAYRGAKRDYGALRLARDTAADTLEREGANRSFSLSDYLTTIAGASVFDTAIPGAGLAMGFLTGALNKWARENGPRLAAVGAHRLSRLNAARLASAETQNRTALALQRLIARGPSTQRGTRGSMPARLLTVAAYDETVREVQQWANNPLAATDRLHEKTAGLAEVAPKVHAHAALSVQRGVDYLHLRVPPASVPDLSPLGHLRTQRPPSDGERIAFMRAARAVTDPGSVIEDMENGRLTPQAVDALKNVYPQIYADLVQTAFAELADADEAPPYETLVQLSTLLGVPLDPSLQPEFIARMQASHASAAPTAQPPSQAVAPRPAPGIAGQAATETQRLLAG
jgi:hypothetical protein